MTAQGTTVDRYDNQSATALRLILLSKSPAALKTQKQLVNNRIPLVNTDVGQVVNEGFLRAKREFEEELAAVREERDAAIKSSMASHQVFYQG